MRARDCLGPYGSGSRGQGFPLPSSSFPCDQLHSHVILDSLSFSLSIAGWLLDLLASANGPSALSKDQVPSGFGEPLRFTCMSSLVSLDWPLISWTIDLQESPRVATRPVGFGKSLHRRTIGTITHPLPSYSLVFLHIFTLLRNPSGKSTTFGSWGSRIMSHSDVPYGIPPTYSLISRSSTPSQNGRHHLLSV